MPDARVLLCDKPAGITSHDLVAEIRRELGGRGRRNRIKVGHAGTLDPFATGLLIILIGRATRLQRYLLNQPKTYIATARLGWRSTTGDPDGELTETGRVPAETELRLPTGRIRQRLPMTSAVKVDGERLYKRAHRGETITTPEREVEVYSARLLERPDPDRAVFEITCAAGTYIRTLIETLDDAYCEGLRRTAIGPLQLVPGKRVEITPAAALSFLPTRELDPDEAQRVGHGGAVELQTERPDPTPADRYRLTHRDQLVAVARAEGQLLRPEVVLL